MNFALLIFVFIGLFSPGPNVIMLANSGATFGFRRSLPHLVGVVIGVGFIGAAVGLGIGTILQIYPVTKMLLRVIAIAWIFWLAYSMFRSALSKGQKEEPFKFTQALFFQWVNPKIWAVALLAIAFVADLSPIEQAVALAIAFSGVNLFVCLFWTFAGSLLSLLITQPRHWKIFSGTMAIFLALSALPLVFLK